MSQNDWLILAAMAATALVLGSYAMRNQSRTRTYAQPSSPRTNPGRSLIDHMDELGKDRAGLLIEDRLGSHRAAKFMADMRDAFGTPANPPGQPGPNG